MRDGRIIALAGEAGFQADLRQEKEVIIYFMNKTITTDIAPDFVLYDTEGKEVHLSDYKGKKNVVLVFNRGLG